MRETWSRQTALKTLLTGGAPASLAVVGGLRPNFHLQARGNTQVNGRMAGGEKWTSRHF